MSAAQPNPNPTARAQMWLAGHDDDVRAETRAQIAADLEQAGKPDAAQVVREGA